MNSPRRPPLSRIGPESLYGPSVISGPVTQTLTPSAETLGIIDLDMSSDSDSESDTTNVPRTPQRSQAPYTGQGPKPLGTQVVPLERDHWNESEGLKMIDRFAWRKDIKAIRKDLEHNFYASCAFSAAMTFVEEEMEVVFRENSLRIKYRQPADTMGLDRSTITSLELFQNIRNVKATLLQPSTNRDEILARHDAVEELSSNENLFTELRASLKKLLHIDVERSIPWENTAPVGQVIEEAIEQDAIYSKVPIDIKNNRLWAIKAQPNSVLERARQLYRDLTNEMHQYVEELNKKFQEQLGTAPELRLGSDNHYCIRFQWSDIERELNRQRSATESSTPLGVQHWRQRQIAGVETLNGVRRKQHYDCQTLDLIQKSSQIQRQADIITAQSDKFVVKLKDSLLEHAESLLALNEATAVLDMLGSFAHLATTQNYVRPILTGNLVLKGSRHPVMEVRKQNFVPSDVYSGDQGARFQVVTGGNMSGKSTFIRTIALIQIMAQAGSFVPATYAAVPVCDRLFTRLSTEDKPESNLGTFAVEMTEMNLILSVLSVHVAGESAKSGTTLQITLPHTIAPGPVKNEDYGLDLARRFLPERVITNAAAVCNFLRERNSNKSTGPVTKAVKQNKLILALPDLLKQAYNSTMDDSALASYLKKLQTELTIRMNMAADDESKNGRHDGGTNHDSQHPVFEKPTEEELEAWKKKCDVADRRIMQANMALSLKKKRSIPDDKAGNDYFQKRSKTENDDTRTVISQPVPINRGSLIEELRRGACTPIMRVETPSSFQSDPPELYPAGFVMEEMPSFDATTMQFSTPILPQSQRPISISSDDSSDYENDFFNTGEDVPSAPGKPAQDFSAEVEQPLQLFEPPKQLYARKELSVSVSENESEEEAPTPTSLARSRAGTHVFELEADHDMEDEMEEDGWDEQGE
ncbi:MutS protein msh4 [Collariella sp. IMI 366227]|nr:MutS protein msh4 [Collariella sp. IMI 366227]